jgi:hypothetical protein
MEKFDNFKDIEIASSDLKSKGKYQMEVMDE